MEQNGIVNSNSYFIFRKNNQVLSESFNGQFRNNYSFSNNNANKNFRRFFIEFTVSQKKSTEKYLKNLRILRNQKRYFSILSRILIVYSAYFEFPINIRGLIIVIHCSNANV